MDIQRAFERESDELDRQLANGEITSREHRQFTADLIAALRDCEDEERVRQIWILEAVAMAEREFADWTALLEEHNRLREVAKAALDFYDVSWQIGGSPLDLAAVFGPDFVPPGPEELEKAAHKLREALLAAGYGRPLEKR